MQPMMDVSQVTVKSFLTGLQISVGALAAGLVVMTGVLVGVMLSVFGQAILQNDANLSFILMLAGAGLWVALAVGSFVIPGIASRQNDEELRRLLTALEIPPGSDAAMLDEAIKPLNPAAKGKLIVAYQSPVITSAALAEAAGMLNAIFYFLTGQPLLLVLVAGSLGLILYRFPTLTRFRTWLEGLVSR